MMNVVFINNTLETFTPTHSGAVATVIHECALMAQADGIKPLVIGLNCEHKPYDDVESILVNYPRVPKSKLGVLACRAERKLLGYRHLRHRAFIGRLIKTIRSSGASRLPMILHNDPELAVLLRRKFPHARIIHLFHNQLECKERFRKQFAGVCDEVVAVSGFTARWIENYFALKPKSVHVVYNGVNLDRFHPASQPPDGPPVIGFVGRTGIEKAPDLLLRAAKQLAMKTKNFRLQLVGSNHWGRFEMDEYQQRLSELAAGLERDGIEVRRPGHIDRQRLPDELRRAQIHVVPSRWEEPCALTLFEGMATGCAMVASRTGGTPEVIGDVGLFFQRDSVDELANHLESLVKSPELRQQMGARARARAEKLTWAATWAGFKKLARL